MNISEMFPNGLAVRVRTGRKNDKGQHIAKAIPVRPEAWNASFMALVIESGCRAVVAEKANTVPTEGGAKVAWAEAVFAEADKGMLPTGLVSGRGAGGGAAAGFPVNEVAAIAARIAKWNVQLTAKAAGTGVKGRVTDSDRANAAKKIAALRDMVTGEGGNARFDVAKVRDWIAVNDPAAFGAEGDDMVL